MGKAMFQIAGVFAELERSILRERITAGIARALDKGTKSGKPIGRPRIPALEDFMVAAEILAVGHDSALTRRCDRASHRVLKEFLIVIQSHTGHAPALAES
jgi:DNA invertase Pin-like site-specific DNA recombinase